jgi:hypothetical protein
MGEMWLSHRYNEIFECTLGVNKLQKSSHAVRGMQNYRILLIHKVQLPGIRQTCPYLQLGYNVLKLIEVTTVDRFSEIPLTIVFVHSLVKLYTSHRYISLVCSSVAMQANQSSERDRRSSISDHDDCQQTKGIKIGVAEINCGVGQSGNL